eukprot:CAMPEP_0202975944 /NCGR_PEP_ID=MMETSP1396-20130829/73334_1 /ASSEMBLY_ACC=CAM_ASM_000872 /TAXON_ID= /ORGANISM="Pseudokeronopsis sp., Strain Brazil" /LENGTH=53 /DNA_ID=CAMNT_0049712441 /DNA_START=218 /DNA_END=379 /DNA_ORIENTATION=+
MTNYIDPEIIDKIKSASKPPVFRKNSNNMKELSAKEENKLRIEKMKQLYGLYK